MRTSQNISNISAALLKAQKNIGSASKGSANPFFKSKYADLGAVMEACKEALNNEGISVLQPVQSGPSEDFVETILLHESGEFIASEMKLILAKQDMQAYGSAVSYARRYSLQSLVFIPAEDDDGEKTMSRTSQLKEKPKTNLEARSESINKTLNEEQKKEVNEPVVNMTPLTITTIENKPSNRRTSFRQSKVPTQVVTVDENVVTVSHNKSESTELNF